MSNPLQARLALLREGSGLTDRELAGLFGVARSTLTCWAEGQNLPHGRTSKLRAGFLAQWLVAAQMNKLLPLPNLDRAARVYRLGCMRTRLVARLAEQLGT